MVKQQLNLKDFYLLYLNHRPVIPHQLRHMNAYHMKEAFKYQETKLKKQIQFLFIYHSTWKPPLSKHKPSLSVLTDLAINWQSKVKAQLATPQGEGERVKSDLESYLKSFQLQPSEPHKAAHTKEESPCNSSVMYSQTAL